jgi:hypothetical protein
MPRVKKNDHLVELAKRGAQARLSDLVHEIKLLMGLFPHLKDNFSKDELPIGFLLKRGARGARAAAAQTGEAGAQVARQTRNLSAAARRAISNAQKKRWAAHRAARSAAKSAAKKA